MQPPPPAIYRPFLSGRYETGMGLYPLGTDFGQGEADQFVFQHDDQTQKYRTAKAAALRDPNSGCKGRCDCPEPLLESITAWVQSELERTSNPNLGQNLEAMAMQLPEDLAIIRCDDHRDWVCWSHICLPSGWDPAQVIGQSFAEIHRVVPGMAPLIKSGHKIARHMTQQGPWVRFVWGLQFDDQLDQHPKRRARPEFDPTLGNLWIKVERQVLVPFPDHDAALFVIRPFVLTLSEALPTPDDRDALVAALESMSAEARRYKNILEEAVAITGFLQNLDYSA